MQTNMTSKGQVTIPKHVRLAVGIAPGARVEVASNDAGEIVIRAVDTAADLEGRRARIRAAIESVRGSNKIDMATDEFMAMIREPVSL